MDFLDPDFQEGADTPPRLVLTHIAPKPNKLVFSQLDDALSSRSNWPENKEKKKKNVPSSDHSRKVELLQLAFVFYFHEVSRNIKMEEVRSMAFSY